MSIIRDHHGDWIARHHEGIQIYLMLLAFKIVMALVRILNNQHLKRREVGQGIKSVQAELVAKLDGRTVLKAKIKPDLLRGVDSKLLAESNRARFLQDLSLPLSLPWSETLECIDEAIEYIDAEVLECQADLISELVGLPAGSSLVSDSLNTFMVLVGDNNLLLDYRDGQVKENALAYAFQESEILEGEILDESKVLEGVDESKVLEGADESKVLESVDESKVLEGADESKVLESVDEELKRLPEKKNEQQQELPSAQPIEDKRLAELACLIVRHREPESGIAKGRNYSIEERDGGITIWAEDGRGEIFSSSQDGYKNEFEAKDYENFGKIDQFVAQLEQQQQQTPQLVESTRSQGRERILSL